MSGTSSWSCARRAGSGKRGEEHIDRGGLYPFMRGAITVVMRDLNVATLLGDIVEGVPVVYSTFVGYDEVAHHSGIEQPDAFAVLKQHDAQLARLERADRAGAPPLPPGGALGPRPEPGPAVPPALRRGAGGAGARARSRAADVYAPPAPDEGLTSVGGALTDARDEDTAGGRMLARATRDRVVDGEVVLGPNREAAEKSDRGRLRITPRSCSPRAASG